MEIKIKKKPFKQEDILRELELADRNCQMALIVSARNIYKVKKGRAFL